MKMTLTQAVILNRLTIDVRPQMTPAGHVEFVSNPKRQEYYVFDNHRDAPVGFGVRVTATKKTYIIQRRVRSGHRPDGAEAIAGRQVIKAVAAGRKLTPLWG